MTLDKLLPSTEEEEKTGAVKEPSKRWRNRWMGEGNYVCRQTRDAIRRGEPYWGWGAWPTKEVAEEKALDAIREWRAQGLRPDTYLGPFPLTDDDQ